MTYIELDLTGCDSKSNSSQGSQISKKSAQKRPTAPVDENGKTVSETFQPDTSKFNLSCYESIAKVNRKLTEFEKRLNDRLSKNSSILETM